MQSIFSKEWALDNIFGYIDGEIIHIEVPEGHHSQIMVYTDNKYKYASKYQAFHR